MARSSRTTPGTADTEWPTLLSSSTTACRNRTFTGRAERKNLPNTKIQHDDPGAAAIVSRQQQLSSYRIWIEQTVARCDESRPVRICRNCRASIEQRIAVKIMSNCNVERRSRIGDREGAEPQPPLARDR